MLDGRSFRAQYILDGSALADCENVAVRAGARSPSFDRSFVLRHLVLQYCIVCLCAGVLQRRFCHRGRRSSSATAQHIAQHSIVVVGIIRAGRFTRVHIVSCEHCASGTSCIIQHIYRLSAVELRTTCVRSFRNGVPAYGGCPGGQRRALE